MSYENLLLYGATIPSFNTDDEKKIGSKKKDEEEEVVDINNPEDWGKIKGFFKNRK